jgi:hypothetical protein
VRLALATGKLARKSDRAGMQAHFESNGWLLFDDDWIRVQLQRSAELGYENEVATIVAKLLLRERKAKADG